MMDFNEGKVVEGDKVEEKKPKKEIEYKIVETEPKKVKVCAMCGQRLDDVRLPRVFSLGIIITGSGFWISLLLAFIFWISESWGLSFLQWKIQWQLVLYFGIACLIFIVGTIGPFLEMRINKIYKKRYNRVKNEN